MYIDRLENYKTFYSVSNALKMVCIEWPFVPGLLDPLIINIYCAGIFINDAYFLSDVFNICINKHTKVDQIRFTVLSEILSETNGREITLAPAGLANQNMKICSMLGNLVTAQ